MKRPEDECSEIANLISPNPFTLHHKAKTPPVKDGASGACYGVSLPGVCGHDRRVIEGEG